MEKNTRELKANTKCCTHCSLFVRTYHSSILTKIYKAMILPPPCYQENYRHTRLQREKRVSQKDIKNLRKLKYFTCEHVWQLKTNVRGTMELCGQQIWLLFLALPLTSHISLGKLFFHHTAREKQVQYLESSSYSLSYAKRTDQNRR